MSPRPLPGNVDPDKVRAKITDHVAECERIQLVLDYLSEQLDIVDRRHADEYRRAVSLAGMLAEYGHEAPVVRL